VWPLPLIERDLDVGLNGVNICMEQVGAVEIVSAKLLLMVFTVRYP
jgi:hypothetical protein